MSEPTNADRAEWAQQALDVFGATTFGGKTFTGCVENTKRASPPGRFADTDAPGMLRDLMTNLYHLARQHGMDVERLREGCFQTFADEEFEEANP